MTASALYVGTIRHRRVRDRATEFRHGLALAYVDLDELPSLLGGRLVAPRPGVVRFRRSDYLGRDTVPLADSVRALVAERLGTAPAGPIRLLTQLRTLGHCFNPVSFYYCYDEAERLQALVAEVTNTPWGERHAYVIGAGGARIIQGGMDKALHVSPFMEMDQRYEVRATEPAATLSVHISSHQEGERAFDATLALERRELTARTLAESTAASPREHAADARPHLRPRHRALAAPGPARRPPGARMTERTARRIALTLLRRIHVGRLTVVEGERRTVIGEGAPQATIVVRSPRTWREVLRGGLGLGESYADGLWDTPDLTAVIELAARNMGGIDELRRRLSPIREPYQRGRQLLTRNTPERAREGIARPLRPGQRPLLRDPRPVDDVLLRGLRAARPVAAGGAGGQARAHLPQARHRRGRPRARDRHRLGQLRGARSADAGVPRHHDDALRRAARARGRARRRRRPRRPRHGPALATTASWRGRSTSSSRSR